MTDTTALPPENDDDAVEAPAFENGEHPDQDGTDVDDEGLEGELSAALPGSDDAVVAADDEDDTEDQA